MTKMLPAQRAVGGGTHRKPPRRGRRPSVRRRTVLAAALILVTYGVVRAGPPAFDYEQPALSLSSSHMQMVEATTADAFTPASDPLKPSGWTATASDQESGNPASAAVDGNDTTFWHSEYSPKTVALPHSITINMHAAHWVAGLTYLPRQDSSFNGDIGRYSISVSRNDKNWGSPVATGTWQDDKSLKTAVFGGVFTQYVRLTALTEAGNRGPWTSAAEIGLLGDPKIGPALPRTGWSAYSDSTDPGNWPGNVLDGDGLTIWHTATTGTQTLPHYIEVDMHKTNVVSGVSYLPRQDGNQNGNITRYAVYVSSNGTTWGNPVTTGSWANDTTQKYATFKAVSARFVRLTATATVGAPSASGAEFNVLGVAPSVAAGGRWSAPIGFPLVPVSAVMLPNDKLLTFSAVDDMEWTKTADAITNVAVLDLKTNTVSEPVQVNTHHQMFCEGLALLANGDLLVNGGSNDLATSLYDPYTNKWSIGPQMNIPRAYQGDATLSTGQVLTLGGSWYDSAGDKNGEIYTPSASGGSWRELSGVVASAILTNDPAGVFRADNHVWMFAQANGTAFQAGPSKEMHWITTTGNGSITAAGLRGTANDEMNGDAVMYGVGKIIALGGATAYQDAGSVTDVQATRDANTINISGGPTKPVKVAATGPMAYARTFSNSVVLPNDDVLVVGGQQHPQPFTDTGAVLSPELWNPSTGKFTIMAPELIPRTYHSEAILLPDGRVFSGGGGLCGGTICATNHPDGQIFSPPYLFNSNGTARTRPVIKTAPAKATDGTYITVTTNSATPKFSLIRMGAVTHTVDSDQRLVPVTPKKLGTDKYRLYLPASRGTLVPGNYMLFALNSSGTPSVAKIISIH
jgi:galactose oxidase